MQIKFELPDDIAQGLKTKWTDLPRAALESFALEAYRSNAFSAAQLRRLLGFETRMQVDDFLKEHEVYDFTWRTLSRIARRSGRFGKGAALSRPPCAVPGESKCHQVDRPSSADHRPVIRILPGKTANVGGRLVRLSLRFASPKASGSGRTGPTSQ